MSRGTYEGTPCRTCQSTERYLANNRCMACSRNAARNSSAKARARKNGARSMNKVPDAPVRENWRSFFNEFGDRVYVDPVIQFKLQHAGKYT